MRSSAIAAAAAWIGLLSFGNATMAGDDYHDGPGRGHERADQSVQLGARPFYLLQGMDAGPLKSRLLKCQNGPFRRTNFSIGHRGAALQFPEHTQESYEAAARMGAGVVECDVTFTKDGRLVCRHDECDLHTTTNIVDTELNASCSTPWIPVAHGSPLSSTILIAAEGGAMPADASRRTHSSGPSRI